MGCHNSSHDVTVIQVHEKETEFEHLHVIPMSHPIWKALCLMFQVDDPENLGVGRDVKEKDAYNMIRPIHGWKLGCPHRASLHDTAQQMVVRDLQDVQTLVGNTQVKSKLHAAAAQLQKEGVTEEVQELFLLHGTKPQSIRSIMRNGLNEKMSSGLFGKGIYLAEDVSKIDQYCTVDSGPCASEEGLQTLHEELYSDSDLQHPGAVFYAFVCRATIGIPIYTKDGEHNMHPPGNKLFLNEDKRELSVVPGSDPPVMYHTLIAEAGPSREGFRLQRHREFVIFESNRVLEEYLVAYKRELDPKKYHGLNKATPHEVQEEQGTMSHEAEGNVSANVREDRAYELQFHGNAFVSVGNVHGIPVGNAPRTVSVEFYPTAAACANLVSWGDGHSSSRRFSLHLVPNGAKVCPCFCGQGNDHFKGGNHGVSLNQWSHAAVTYNGAGSISMFVNGKCIGTANAGSLDTEADAQLCIGRNTENRDDEFFIGSMASVRIWNRALCPDEVKDLHLRKTVSSDGLVGEWLFAKLQPTNSGLLDGIDGHDGVLCGATWGSRSK